MSILGEIFGAQAQAQGQQQAAQAELQGINNAIGEQRYQYNTTRSDFQPYRVTGQGALNQLAQMYGLPFQTGSGANAQQHQGSGVSNFSAFYQSPDYKFALQQGLQGITANAAATGGLDSGAIRKAEIGYSSGLATQNFNNYANRLSGLAGLGQTSTSQLGTLGSESANQISQLQQNAGFAQGNSYINQGNIWGNLYSSLGGQLGGTMGSSYGSGLMSLLSDERLKTDVERIGHTDRGHNIYLFRYIGDPVTRMGVMAQEVEQTVPEAVSETPDGFKCVDYAMLRKA